MNIKKMIEQSVDNLGFELLELELSKGIVERLVIGVILPDDFIDKSTYEIIKSEAHIQTTTYGQDFNKQLIKSIIDTELLKLRNKTLQSDYKDKLYKQLVKDHEFFKEDPNWTPDDDSYKVLETVQLHTTFKFDTEDVAALVHYRLEGGPLW